MIKFIALCMLVFLGSTFLMHACQVCDLAESKQAITNISDDDLVCDWCGSISLNTNKLLQMQVKNSLIILHSECLDMYLDPNSFELCNECTTILSLAKSPMPTAPERHSSTNSLRSSLNAAPIKEDTREYGRCMARAFACFPCLYCLLTGHCSCKGFYQTYCGACKACCCCSEE